MIFFCLLIIAYICPSPKQTCIVSSLCRVTRSQSGSGWFRWAHGIRNWLFNQYMNTIEDQILKYIHEHSIAHPKDIRDRFPKAGQVLASLDEMKLTTKVPSKQFSVTLTDKGREALAMGYEKYTERQQHVEENKIRREKISMICAIISTAIALISFILSLLIG